MAAVLTLDSTPPSAESFTFLTPTVEEEVSAGEEDSGGGDGLGFMDIG